MKNNSLKTLPILRVVRGHLIAGAFTPLILGGPLLVDANAQTLNDAMGRAYENNPSLRAARSQLRAVDEGVPQALSNWRPTVTLNGDAGFQQTDNDPGTQTDTTPIGGSVRIDQNIYRGGRTVAQTRRAESTVKSERARLGTVEQSVLLSVVTAYMDYVRDDAIIELNKNNVRVLRRQLEAAQDRFRVGEVTRTDVSQAESRLSRGRADLIRAEGALIQSRAAYRNVVGDSPKGKLVPPQKPPPDLVSSEKSAVGKARTSNFSVLQAKFAEEAARHQVRLVVGEFYPLATVRGEFAKSQDRIREDSEEQSASVTARITVPLYQAGGVSARVREAKETAVQRRDELGLATRNAVEAAARAWEALQTARAQIRAFSAEIRAAQIALEGVQQEALVGSRTVLDVLDAEQELFDARVNLVSALRDEVVAAYQLRLTTGDLTAKGLGLQVQLYDPKTHYNRVRDKWFGTGIKSD